MRDKNEDKHRGGDTCDHGLSRELESKSDGEKNM